ncbi:MAG: TIGR03943 family protein [Cyanophyceae cyanobacterium]
MSPAKLRSLSSKFPWLDVVALLAWGGLLLKFWLTGQLGLLIHPNYFGLVFASGIVLLLLGVLKAGQLLKAPGTEVGHISLLPPGWGSGLLAVTAILGFVITPSVLSSQAAVQRGITELPMTRTQPQSFRATTQPEERSLIEWIRTLNVYPEPDAYAGQKANVTGFVVHSPKLSDNYLLLCRFVITCCAVDAYPVGIPVKLDVSRSTYAPDTWLTVAGEMITETLPQTDSMSDTISNKRQLVLSASRVETVPTPANPYEY